VAPGDEPILELVIDEVHDDVQLHAMDKMLPVSDFTWSPVASARSSHSVEHVEVQEEIDEDPLDIIPAHRASSPLRILQSLMTQMQLPWNLLLTLLHLIVGMSRHRNAGCT
jgi:hypothetical protein